MSQATAAEQSTALGEPVVSYKPDTRNVGAAFVFSVGLLIGGIWLSGYALYCGWRSDFDMPFESRGDDNWMSFIAFTVFGVGMVIGSIFLIRYARWLLSHTVHICSGGIAYGHGAGCDEVPWCEIQVIRETVLYYRTPLLKGPLKLLSPVRSQSSYVVVANDGKQLKFDDNSLRDIDGFGRLLREIAESCHLNWEVYEHHT